VCITFRENVKIAATVVFSECIVKYIFNIDTVRKLIFHRSSEIYIKDRIIPRESNGFFSLRRNIGEFESRLGTALCQFRQTFEKIHENCGNDCRY